MHDLGLGEKLTDSSLIAVPPFNIPRARQVVACEPKPTHAMMRELVDRVDQSTRLASGVLPAKVRDSKT